MKKNFWLNLFLVLVGVVLGTMLAHVTSGVSYLSWLSFGQSFGTSAPFVLELGILTLTFGINITISVATVICIVVSLLVGRLVVKG